jgi:hypothetical protein
VPACERCWAEYNRRQLLGEHDLTYSEVVAQREERGGACSPEEQCGETHLLLDWKDGSRRCRCGARSETD